jgi:hypothetical protein
MKSAKQATLNISPAKGMHGEGSTTQEEKRKSP